MAALAAGTPAAHAAPDQASMFMDDNLLLYRGDDTADKTLQELKSLGVDWVRVSVPWRAFAPDHRAARRPASFTDPTDSKQYDPIVFDLHDHLLRVASQLGIKVLFNITGGAPLWATGTARGHHIDLQYKPSPKQFGQFVQMLATRYDGKHVDENQGGATLPRVSAWSIWNEPNSSAQLQPQWERSRKTGTWVPLAARVYRGLVRAATGALQRTGHGQDTILLGETAPRGVDGLGKGFSMRPVTFLNALFCLNATTHKQLHGQLSRDLGCSDYGSLGPLQVNGYAHHPYSIVSAPDVADPNPLDITLADAPRLAQVLDAAGALHRIPAGLPYWWTEYGWQTNPPDPTARGVSQADQATWLAQAERITRADGRARALTQFLLRDDLPRDEANATLDRRWGTYQTGLELADGTRKPGYDAYRLPLVASGAKVRAGGSLSLWGFVRPLGAGQSTVQVQFAPEGSTDYANVGGAVTVDGTSRTFTVDVQPTQSGSYRFTWSLPAGPAPKATGLAALLGQQPAAPPPTTYTSVAVPVHVG